MTALKTLLFTIFVPGTVTVLVPWLLRSEPGLPLSLGRASVLGWPPLLAGVAVYLWCAWDFTVVGRGTPAPNDPPRELVVGGLYRLPRNPMYVGVSLVLLGEAVLFSSALLLLYAALVLCAFHLRVLPYDEPTPRRTFGESYAHYCRRVPRWLAIRPRDP